MTLTTRLLGGLCVCSVGVLISAAQEPEQTPDMTTDSIAALQRANAAVSRTVLENGMVCLIKEDASAPVVAIQIWVGTGSIHEDEYLGSGISHAIEHMIFKGTEKRKPTDITREIDGAGGNINAYTSFDRTVFHVEMPSDQWRVGLDVLSDAVQNATFPEEEWVKEREVIIREIEMGRDDPERVVSYLLWGTAYREHPYRHPVIGYEEVFSTLTRADLAAFAHRRYHSDNTIVVVVGNIRRSEVEEAIKAAFKSFERRRVGQVVLPTEPSQAAARYARKTGDYTLSRMEVAFHTVGQSHPDAAALDVLAIIVGGGDSSRLYRRIKEESKLAYSIDAFSYTPKAMGLFGISSTFETVNEEALRKAIDAEVESWKNGSFTAEEIDKARRQILTSELSSLQTMSGQAGNYGAGEFYAGDPRFSETYLRKVAEVTPATLSEVARRYLARDNMTTAVLAPNATKGAGDTATALLEMPRPARETLPSGIRVITRTNRKLPFAYIAISVGGGVITETAAEGGITKLLSGMLMRGTPTRSRQQIAESIESMGASVAPFSGNDDFGLSGRCLSSDLESTVEIMADCLLNSTLDPAELETEREDQLASIRKAFEDPFFVAQDQMKRLVYAEHPYARNAFGETHTVRSLTRDALFRHFRRHVVAGNLVVSIFGDVDAAVARRLIEKHFSTLPAGGSPLPEAAKAIAQPALPIREEKREPREQAIVIVAYPGVRQGEDRVPALAVLKTAMSGLSSELANEVREKRGLAYYVGALNRVGVAPGLYALYAGTTGEAAAEVEKLMLADVARIAASGLSDEELERARMQLLGNHDMRLQDELAVARQCASDEVTGLGFDHLFGAKERIQGVTGAAVRDCAATLLKTELSATSVVLPVAVEAVQPQTP